MTRFCSYHFLLLSSRISTTPLTSSKIYPEVTASAPLHTFVNCEKARQNYKSTLEHMFSLPTLRAGILPPLQAVTFVALAKQIIRPGSGTRVVLKRWWTCTRKKQELSTTLITFHCFWFLCIENRFLLFMLSK